VAPKQKPGRSKQDYGTPDDFLDAARERLQITQFVRDLAASPENAVCLNYYTEKDNALVQPWHGTGRGMWVEGEWNWLNPPFSRIAPWVRRAYETSRSQIPSMTRYAAQTAVLVPAGVGSNWWRDWVHEKAHVLLLNGRLTFKGTPPNPKTGKPDAYPKDCALLLYSPCVTPGYEIWAWNGVK
jgi:phage N-6-adenine-methyltransferase